MRFGWYSDMSRVERNTYWACFGGLALDSMDTTIYALVIPVLIAVVGITRQDAGLLASAALIGSAIGGWLAGIVADRIGRVRVLQITILWVALTTLAAAFTNGFHGLLVVRSLQGLGYGGEAAVGGVLISEVIAPRLRGRAAASVQSGYAIGYAVSVGLMAVVFAVLPQEIAWRAFFAIGVLPAGLVFLVRRLVPESTLFTDRRREAAAPFWTIFRQPHLGRTIPAAVMSTGIFGGAYTLITWLPTYLRTVLHLSVTSSAGYLFVNIAGSLVGPFVYGALADRIGRRPSFMIFLVLQAANVGVYTLAPIGAGATVVLGFFLGALQGGLAAGMLPTFAELFPTSIRASGEGFCLSGGRGFGSVVPATVGLLAASGASDIAPLGTAMGGCALASYAVAFIAALLLPETSGADLRATRPLAEPSERR
jgi:MFS family permease